MTQSELNGTQIFTGEKSKHAQLKNQAEISK